MRLVRTIKSACCRPDDDRTGYLLTCDGRLNGGGGDNACRAPVRIMPADTASYTKRALGG